MGLLDDAIREHLELKRRRGADPAEVAREQQEALDSPSDGQDSTELEASAERGEGAVPTDEDGMASAIEQVDDPAAIKPARASSDAGATGSLEETAELDMKAVLEHEEPPAPEHTASSEEGLLAWDANQSGARGRSVTNLPPGQAHLRFKHDAPTDPELEK